MPAKGRPTSVMIPIPFTPVKMAGAVNLGILSAGVVPIGQRLACLGKSVGSCPIAHC